MKKRSYRQALASILSAALILSVVFGSGNIVAEETDPASEAQTELSTETVTETGTEAAITETITEPEAEPAAKPETETEAEPVTETEALTEPAAENVTEIISETTAEPVTETETELEAEQPVTEPETEAEQPVTETEPEALTEPAAEPESPIETESVTEGETSGEREPETESVTEPETETETETEARKIPQAQIQSVPPAENLILTVPSNAIDETVQNIQTKINDLPDVSEVQGMEQSARDEVYLRAQHVWDAYDALTDAQKEQVDTGRLTVLLNYFNGQAEAEIADNTVATVTIDGTTTEYSNITSAFAAADGHVATITLLRDASAGNISINSGTILLTSKSTEIELSADINVGGGIFTVESCIWKGYLHAYGGSAVISGGEIEFLDVRDGGSVVISDGQISNLDVLKDGSVTISNGYIENLNNPDGRVDISGGTIVNLGIMDSGTLNYIANSLSLTPETLLLNAGASGILTAEVNQNTINIKNTDFKIPVTWSSSDENVATVKGSGTGNTTGTVTATGPGKATITASAGGKTETCTVTVKKKQPTPKSVSAGSDLYGNITASSYFDDNDPDIPKDHGAIEFAIAEGKDEKEPTSDWKESTWIVGYGCTFDRLKAGTYYTVFARFAETDVYSASDAVTDSRMTYYEKPQAIIDFINEALDGLVANVEYNIESSTEPLTADANGKIGIKEEWFGKTISVYRSLNGANYSIPQSVTIPSRSSAPELQINTGAEGVAIPDDCYYNTTSGEYAAEGWTKGTGALIQVGPEDSIYIYKAAASNTFRSAVQTLTAPRRLEAPAPSIDYQKETLQNLDTGMQYSLDGGKSWTPVTGSEMALSSFGWNGSRAVTVSFQSPATNTAYASTVSSVTLPARPAITLESTDATASSLTIMAKGISAEADVQYQLIGSEGSLSEDGWKDADLNGGCTFSKLSSNTSYTIYVRCGAVQETDTVQGSFSAQASKAFRTSAAAFTLSIPASPVTAGDAQSTAVISIDSTRPFDLGYNGKITITAPVDVTLNRENDPENTILLASLLVGGVEHTDAQSPVAVFDRKDSYVTVSFGQPRLKEGQGTIPAGSYKGTITFTFTYDD